MDIVFWSGGKDAYLSLEFHRQNFPDRPICLLTTYQQDSQVVPHQNIAVTAIEDQADKLGLQLHLVPLPADCPNDIYMQKIQTILDSFGTKIDYLVFGDWKLQDIRTWREEQYGRMGYRCHFPIWEKSIHELLPILSLKPVEVTISAVQEPYREYIRVGETYNQKFIQQLPPDIDPMGETGEFHTKVSIQTFDDIEPKKQPLL